MRITSQMASQRFIKNTHKNNEEIAKLQEQISSGRKFNKISDNPSVALQGLNHRSSLMQIEQYQRNIEDGQSWLQAQDDALGSATEVLQRVRELMVQASNDTNNAENKKTIAIEIKALKEQLGNIANSSFSGRNLFAGSDANTLPYQNGELITVGQSGMQWKIGQGQTIVSNVSADSVFGVEVEVEGKNLFESLDSIIQDLDNGENPNSYLSSFDKQIDNVLNQRAIVGVNTNLLEMTANKLDQANYLTQKVWSESEATDIAQAYMELSAQESTLKASLTAGSKIMQITLADFLR
jgi:flagellar hook-associated protein 3 FlgL